MPKSIQVLPDRLSQTGKLAQVDVPVYRYRRSFSDELASRGESELYAILRSMLIIREFESMLHAFRSTGEYEGLKYIYRGPAHLSVGQEASAVGMALGLSAGDRIFGSHRSHGEFIAKGLTAISQLGDNELGTIMHDYRGGSVLKVIQASQPTDMCATAEKFLLFGFLSEVFMCATGFNRGMGGSMHAFFPPFGAYPNNAIVGGSAGIATGSALFQKQFAEGISVAISGDGSTGCGAVWEAMNFASMGQFSTLWEPASEGGLPILFYFNNNFYAMGGQTSGETMGWDRLSRIGAGINANAMHAETVDGTNPLAVADAVARQREHLIQGQGPALLDVECYRYSGHSTSDANAYRSREEMKAWQAHDCIERYAEQLIDHQVMDELGYQALKTDVKALIVEIVKLVIDPQKAPPVDIKAQPTFIGDLMFSNQSINPPNLPVDENLDITSSARVRQTAKKSRAATDTDGKVLSPMRALTLRDALFEPILHHVTHDETLLIYGEECREWGGAFGVYRGLSDLIPHNRLFNAPISEAAIVATAVGYALAGGRALVELMYADFIGRAGDEIFNQMAKWQSMSGGELTVPVVLRCSIGSKYGAQHSQDWSSLVTHVPGLKVVYPATPYDAKGLMASALCSNDPIVFFESQRLYDATEKWHKGGVPEEYYRIDLGVPSIKRSGDDLTLLTIGPSLYPAIEAADKLQSDLGLQAEVIDARSLVPFDYTIPVESVKRTGRLLIVCEASERSSFAMTLAANINRYAFGSLKAAPQVLGAPNWIVPGAEMESTYFPQPDDIIACVCREFYPEHEKLFDTVRTWNDRELAKRGL